MSNSQQQPILYDPDIEEFTYAGRLKIRKMFKINHYPSPEILKQLSEETGAPLSKCLVCLVNFFDF